MEHLASAVAAMTATMQTSGDKENWENKAEILCQFAERVSEAVLDRAGLSKKEDSEQRSCITLAIDFKEDLSVAPFPAGTFRVLSMYDVPADLSTYDEAYGSPLASSLLFSPGRVYEVEESSGEPDDEGKIRQVMSYEEAARFVIFFLEEKILQIVRYNRLDKMGAMADLYDQLSSFLA